MLSKRHGSLLVFFAVVLFLGAGSAPAYGQQFVFAAIGTVGTGLSLPTFMAVDKAGDLFIADARNNRVVEIPAGGGVQITVPASGLNSPTGVAVDQAGDVFIGDTSNNRVVEVPAGGGAQTTVGTGLGGPWGVAVDGAGDVFIADTGNNRVVEVPVGGSQITVVSGLSHPAGVAVDGAGDLFITDYGNNQVVEVPPGCHSENCQIFVGNGYSNPLGVAVDGAGNVFVADNGNRQVVEVAPGNASQVLLATPVAPIGVAVDNAGDLFVTGPQTTNGAEIAEEVQYLAVNFGNVNVCPGGQTAPAPCTQTLTLAFWLWDPSDSGEIKVLTQGAPNADFTLGDVWFDSSTYTAYMAVTFAPSAPGVRTGAVQLTDSSGDVLASTTIYGVGEGPALAFGPGTQIPVPATGLDDPWGVALDGAGDVFIADTYNNRVVEVRPDGGAQITVGTGLNNPTGVAVDGAGDIFIADEGNSRVVEVPVGCTTDTCQTTVGSGLSNAFGVAVDGAGDIFIADEGNSRVVEVPNAGNGAYGAQTTVGTGLLGPRSVAVDGAGDVFIADTQNNRVVEVPNAGNGAYSAQITVGNGLSLPSAVAVDAAGEVFIADSGNKRVLKVSGGGGGSSQIAVASGLNYPSGVAVNAVGDVFITNLDNSNPALKVQRSQPPTLSFASTPVGSTSSDSPQLVAIQNIGNQPLMAVPPGLTVGANFQMPVSGARYCTTTFSLTPGTACLLSVAFEPQSVGSFTTAATFTDNALNFIPYASQSITLQGTGVPNSQTTTTALSSSPNPSSYGEAVTFTATIIPQFGGQVTGTVTFKNGSATLGSVVVSGNAASAPISTLATGTHSITAIYSGGGDFSGSTSMPLTQLVQSATAVGTTTALTSSVNPSQSGKAVLFTATVSPKSGTGTPTGKVTFYNGSTALGTVGVSGGVAKLNTTALPPGSDSITAVYGGDANNDGSTSAPVNQLVIATTTVTLTSSPNPSAYGQTVMFSAAVTSAIGAPPNGETVTFKHGATVLGTGTLSDGTASFPTSTLAVGTDAITAVYGGDSNFAAGTSAAEKQVVSKATSTTTLVSSLNPSTVGQAVTFTAAVAPQYTGTATGTVTFQDGTTTLGTEKVSSGVAKFTTSTLASGTHSMTATYNGSTDFASSSAALTQTVN